MTAEETRRVETLMGEATWRIAKGDPSGGQHVFHRMMNTADRDLFDRWLVARCDPLAFEAGTTERRFNRLLSRLMTP